MRNPSRWIVVVAVCVLLMSTCCVFAQDWPQWRGVNRDGHVEGFIAPQQLPVTLTQKWQTTVGTGNATPALVGDKLYLSTRQGGDEVTLCLSAADGSELWQDKYPAQEVTGAASGHPGPRSSPAVADGKVVTIGVGAVISCLDAATGKLVWRKDPFPKVVNRFFGAVSPLIVDGMAIGYFGAAGNGAVIAYDLASGDEKWRWGAEGPDYGSPALLTVGGTKQIAMPTEKSVVGLSVADGKLLWQIPFPLARRAYNAATPIIDGQTLIYGGSQRGTKAWSIEKQGDAFAARELWSNPDIGVQFNTPVLRDGLLFGLTDSGKLFCINAENGQTAWVDTAEHGRGFAAVVSAGPAILALPNTGELIAFEPRADAYTEVTKLKVADTPTYAHPVIAGNKMFVKDETALTLWTME